MSSRTLAGASGDVIISAPVSANQAKWSGFQCSDKKRNRLLAWTAAQFPTRLLGLRWEISISTPISLSLSFPPRPRPQMNACTPTKCGLNNDDKMHGGLTVEQTSGSEAELQVGASLREWSSMDVTRDEDIIGTVSKTNPNPTEEVWTCPEEGR